MKRTTALILPILLALGIVACDQKAETPVRSGDITRINTPGWEDSPHLSPDGRAIYFMYTPYNFWPFFSGDPPVLRGPDRPGHHSNPDGNPFGDSDIYVSTLGEDGHWGAPVNMPFNDDASAASGMPSWDGRAFYYIRDTIGNADLYVARQDAGAWGAPEPIGPPLSTPDYNENNPFITPDEATLYFTSDAPGGFGGNDLYVATRLPDGSWSTPVNLGPVINTAEDEDQFWQSRDRTETYFNRGLVVMRTAPLAGGWAEPQAVDLGGEAAEVSLSDDGQTMLVAVVVREREDIDLMLAHRQPDGSWSVPEPVD